MPAAKRYTETQLGEFMEIIERIPAGKPPEPDFNKNQILDAMRDKLRKRILEDHVPISQIVAELNAVGFSVEERDIRKRTKTANIKGPTGKRGNASPVKRRGKAATRSNDAQMGNAGVRGGMQIDHDEDEI